MGNLEFVETLVIGSGPGGYVAALRSSQLGMRTAIVERNQLGGVCTNVGCIPSKALIAESHRYELFRPFSSADAAVSFKNAQDFKQGIVNKQAGGVGYLLKTAGVSILEGEARLVDEHTAIISQSGQEQSISFKNAILATGSRPIELQAFPVGGRVLSSTEALSLREVPTSLVVIGGGYIGVELGQMYAKFGTTVTILEGGDQVLPGFEAELVSPVGRQLKADGIKMITGATAVNVVQSADAITLYYLKNQEQLHVTAEYVLVTVGRKPNTDGDLGLDRIGLPVTSRGSLRQMNSAERLFRIFLQLGILRRVQPLLTRRPMKPKLRQKPLQVFPPRLIIEPFRLLFF